MPIVELKSKNASFRRGNILLTQKNPTADVSDDIALELMKSGRVTIVDTAAEDSKDQTATTDASAGSEQSSNAGKVDTNHTSLLEELNHATKVDEVEAIAVKYGVDLSGCKNMEQRKTAILEAFEEV